MNSPKRRLRELLQRRLDPVYYEIVNDDNLELLLKKGCIGEAQLVLVTEKELAAPPGDALPALLIGAIKNTFRETRPPPPAADSSAQPETSLSAGPVLTGQHGWAAAALPDKRLSRFWQALSTVKLDHGFLNVPENAPFSYSGSLYVRESYTHLTKEFLTGPNKALLVTGSRGMGKSSWQMHVLWSLAKLGAEAEHKDVAVIMQDNLHDYKYKFCRDGAFKSTTLAAFDVELDDENNFFLSDDKVPQRALARTLLTSSPAHNKTYPFQKMNASTRYMPPWSLEELQAARSIFPSCKDDDTLHARYRLWGGSILYCLARPSGPDSDALLYNAVRTVSVEAMLHMVDSNIGHCDASSRLTHLLPNEDMTDAKADFASNHIADMVFESLRASDANAVSQLLQASASFPDASILRGRVFERWAHHRLQVWEMYNIVYHRFMTSLKVYGTHKPQRHPSILRLCNADEETGQDISVDIRPSHESLIESLEDLATPKANTYCRPRVSNFPAIDSVLTPQTLFQITVGRQHSPVNADDLDNAIKALNEEFTSEKPAVLCLVVPPDQYDKELPLTFEDGAQPQSPLCQVVLCVPLQPTSSIPALAGGDQAPQWHDLVAALPQNTPPPPASAIQPAPAASSPELLPAMPGPSTSQEAAQDVTRQAVPAGEQSQLPPHVATTPALPLVHTSPHRPVESSKEGPSRQSKVALPTRRSSRDRKQPDRLATASSEADQKRRKR